MNKYELWEQKVNCEIPNEENPFDEAGLQHNHLMAIIEEKGNPPDLYPLNLVRF